MDDGLRTCPQCGRRFAPATANHRFCKPECGKAHVKRRKNKESAIAELERWRKENGRA